MFSHIVTGISASFHCMAMPQCIHHTLGCFYLWAIVNTAAMNIYFQNFV